VLLGIGLINWREKASFFQELTEIYKLSERKIHKSALYLKILPEICDNGMNTKDAH